MIEIGSQAPNFSLLDTKREVKSLSDFKGRNTVLAFFPAAFSGVCDKEMCSLQDSMAQLNDVNANIVGICVDGPFTNAEFVKRNNLQFPVLSDYKHEAISTYDVVLTGFAGMPDYITAQRSVFILDAAGVIRFKWIAESPGIEPDYATVKQELTKLG
jgi:peroxiredoxin